MVTACTNHSCFIHVGPAWSTGDADPSSDQQPTTTQVVSLWIVDLSAQNAYLHHFPRVSHSLCFGCASSSIKHMYVQYDVNVYNPIVYYMTEPL